MSPLRSQMRNMAPKGFILPHALHPKISTVLQFCKLWNLQLVGGGVGMGHCYGKQSTRFGLGHDIENFSR